METREYMVPEGKYDIPYIFAFDGNGLTDGNDYRDLVLQVGREAEFILRRVSGLPTIASRAQIRADVQTLFAAEAGVVIPNDLPVCPERTYPIMSNISFDLYNVTRANNLGIFWPQLIFQGARRYAGGGGSYPLPSAFPWRDMIWDYSINFDITSPGNAPVTLKIFQDIKNYDFELRAIMAYRTRLYGLPNPGMPYADFKMVLYDPFPRALMNVPIVDTFVLANADATINFYNSAFPVPAVMYPNGSQLRLDIISLIPPPAGPPPLTYGSYNLRLCGVRRMR